MFRLSAVRLSNQSSSYKSYNNNQSVSFQHSKSLQGYKCTTVTHNNNNNTKIGQLSSPFLSNYRFYSHDSQKSAEDKERERAQLAQKSDQEILKIVQDGKIPAHSLEKQLGDSHRAVRIRRQLHASLDPRVATGLETVPIDHFDYNTVVGACCENVVGYIQIPIGLTGPLLLDGEELYVPMATTEGALVASTHRGIKAITKSGGASSVVVNNGMTRAPLIKMPSVKRAYELKEWIEKMENFYQVAAAFNSTSKFARLSSIKTCISGRNMYLRFKSRTGDAMGMNMVSKGVEKAIEVLQDYFPDLEALSLSGNYCTDKKPSSINWTEGRGKSVVCEAIITSEVAKSVLKVTRGIQHMCDMNIKKNLIGSAMAGSIGGFNAHASNVVTAVFLATGQDPAQNVESSNCITLMEPINDGKDLHVSVTMPSIEVGTVGGGTHLPSQSGCLSMMGVKGAAERPGENAEKLARVVAATVMAGELSLLAALSEGHLVRSHLAHNRKTQKEREGDIGHSLAALKSD